MKFMHFPHYRQLDAMDCGPTCLRMVAKHYGRSVSLEYLRTNFELRRKDWIIEMERDQAEKKKAALEAESEQDSI